MQRCTPTIWIIDFDDSFTMNIAHAIHQASASILVRVVHHLKIHTYDYKRKDLIILGPGPYQPKQYPHALNWLHSQPSERQIFGLCLGLQMLAVFSAATATQLMESSNHVEVIRKAKNPRHGIPVELVVKKHKIFSDLERPIHMIAYNSLVTVSWGADWDIIAKSQSDDEIMAVTHKTRPICGVQFHPESAGSLQRGLFFENLLRFYGFHPTQHEEALCKTEEIS